ncbi:uncharacterized protein PRCAT00004618001 [Priceomyces carsonii]|uniref:uncharacterized protein n=1 Tax=Priceomyces carsonii TaxID=28549 RepID=UPI002ED7B462|nr:unnamed protein product [Priceomyces carsonii]
MIGEIPGRMPIMSYNKEHLDKKLDNLSIGDHPGQAGSGLGSSRGGTVKGFSGSDVSYTTDYTQKPKTSLLSSSLAEERQIRMDNGAGAFGSTQGGNSNSSKGATNDSKQASFSLEDNGMDVEESLKDEHPEPELLASSVGKEMDGRLIPSSSTISLLSLNTQMNDSDSISLPVNNSGNQALAVRAIINNSNIGNKAAFVDRKNSYTNIIGRHSVKHLNQKRLQPYHKFTSPPPENTPSEMVYHSTSQSIPINTKLSNIPDSPSLDPTSIGGSPSRFWLSSQTPPRSLANSWSRNSRTHLFQMLQPQVLSQQTPQQVSQQVQLPLAPQPTYGTSNANYTTAAKRDGNYSPILNPVMTPCEDPPMTPLYLNGANQPESYFGDFSTSQIEEEKDEQESDEET